MFCLLPFVPLRGRSDWAARTREEQPPYRSMASPLPTPAPSTEDFQSQPGGIISMEVTTAEVSMLTLSDDQGTSVSIVSVKDEHGG